MKRRDAGAIAAVFTLATLLPSTVRAAPVCSGTSAVYVPADGVFGLQLFEDEFPNNGDLDFNDQTVAFNYVLTRDDSGKVVQLQATFNVLAIGATFHNGLYLHIPGVVPSAASSISLTTGTATPTTTALTAASGESDFVVQLSADTRTLFANTSQAFINTDPTLPTQSAPSLQLLITFADGQGPASVGAPYDLYIARPSPYTSGKELQIHLPAFAGTDKMDTAAFGKGNDGSLTNAAGLHFVNTAGLPFALSVPGQLEWPSEHSLISSGYPGIDGFAGGDSHSDWYTKPVASNDVSLFSHGAGSSAAPVPQPIGSDLLACLPVTTGPVVGATTAATSTTAIHADGTDSATITATVVDGDGAPVQSRAVVFSCTTDGCAFNPPSGMTDANGKITTTLTATQTGSHTVVIDGGTPSNASINVNFTVPPAPTLTLKALPNGVIADGSSVVTLTATLKHADGTVWSGQNVSFSSDGAGNSLSGSPAQTDGNGLATATLTSTTAGNANLTASSQGLSAATTVQFVPVGDLAAPTNLLVISPQAGAATISWTGSLGAQTYTVLRSDNGGSSFNQVGTTSDPVWNFTDINLSNGKAYQYEITASAAHSNPATSVPVLFTTPLPAPRNLTLSGFGPFSLSWTASAGAASYVVSRGTSAGGEATLTTINGTSYTDSSSFAPSTAYYYVVQATTPDATSARSNEVGNTSLGSPVKIAFTVQPSDTAPGTTMTPAVQVSIEDSLGHVIPSASDTITLSLSTNPVGATLQGTLTHPTVNGVATFNNLSLNEIASGFVMTATSGNYGNAVSHGFGGTVIANSNFENGLTGWILPANCGGTQVDSPSHGQVFTGYFGYNYGDNGQYECALSQTGIVNIDSVDSLRVRFDTRSPVGEWGSGLRLVVTTGSAPSYDQILIGQHDFNSGTFSDTTALNGTTNLPSVDWYSYTSDDLKPLIEAAAPHAGNLRLSLQASQPWNGLEAELDNIKLVLNDPNPPAPSASIASTGGGIPDVVAYAGLPGEAAAMLDGQSWDFGDGSQGGCCSGGVSALQNPTYTYGAVGNYLASYTAQDDYGAARTVFLTPISVTDVVTAGIAVDVAIGGAPLTVNFTDTGTASSDANPITYSWSFGDGASSPLAAPAHTYGAVGTYAVSLNVSDSFGQTASASYLIVVSDPASQQLANSGFDNGTSGWLLPPNCGGAQQDGAIHGSVFTGYFGYNYGNNGQYECNLQQVISLNVDSLSSLRVRLDTRSPVGEWGSGLRLVVTTGSAPGYDQVVIGQHDFNSGAFSDTTALSGTTNLPWVDWYSFTSDDIKPLIEAAAPHATTLRILLQASQPWNGLEVELDNAQLVIGDANPPSPTASITSSTGGIPDSVSYQADPGENQGSVGAQSWDFGDGSQGGCCSGGVSALQNPTYTYGAVGNYLASYTAQDDYGAARTVFLTPISVTDVVTAGIAVDVAIGGAPLTVNFTDTGTASSDANPITYSWSFGDGASSPLAAPAHTYGAVGTYAVSLNVSDSFGQTASASYLIVVSDPASQQLANSGFDNGTSGWLLPPNCGGTQQDGAIHGSVFTGYFGYNYGNNGQYECNLQQVISLNVDSLSSLRVRLDTRSPVGEWGSGLRLVVTTGSAPGYDQVVIGQHDFNSGAFSDTTALSGTTNLPWVDWYSFTSDDIKPLIEAAAPHATTLRILLQASQPWNGLEVELDNAQLVIGDANPPSPTASITSSGTGVPATDAFLGNSGLPSDSPETEAWDFGDGSQGGCCSSGVSTALSPSYTYTQPGTFYISYTAEDAFGAARTAPFLSVSLSVQAVTAGIAASPDEGPLPLAVTFDDTGSGQDGLSYSWSFGDGATSSDRSPSHTYTQQGSFEVSLRVSDSFGNTATANYVIIVTGG